MKKLLFLVLFAAPFFCFAQTDTTTQKQKITYCIAQVEHDGSKFDINLDDGSRGRNGSEIKDSNGKTMKFDTRISALNYITQLGWTLVSSYTLKGTTLEVIAFVFKRPVNQ